MRKIRFGVLGCSSVARRRFLPALAAAENAMLERIGSRDPGKAEAIAAQYHCAKHGGYEDVLQDPNVDAVYISTPPTLHERWLMEAAQAGKHVYCEKPAFTRLEAAIASVGLFREKGLRLKEGYMFRHHPQNIQARALLAQGLIGEPRSFQSQYFYPRPENGNIRLDSNLGGGVFHDSAGYGVAACLDVFRAEPMSIHAESDIDPEAGVDRMIALQILFSGGQLAQSVSAFGLQYKSSYEVTGTTGRLNVERAYAVDPQRPTKLTLTSGQDASQVFQIPAADQFRLAIDDFAASVARGTGAPDYEGDLLRVHAVMDAARRSLELRETVSLRAVA